MCIPYILSHRVQETRKPFMQRNSIHSSARICPDLYTQSYVGKLIQDILLKLSIRLFESKILFSTRKEERIESIIISHSYSNIDFLISLYAHSIAVRHSRNKYFPILLYLRRIAKR